MNTRRPTSEQQEIIDAALTGGNLVIQAGAGTGKTSTLEMIADALPKKALYIAYNKAIATEASGRFPAHVTCKTSHSLAFAAVGRKYARRLNSGRTPSKQVAAILGATWLHFDEDTSLSPAQVARVTADTVRRFCYSADTEISGDHVPFQNGITGAAHSRLKSTVLPLARKYWKDVKNVNGRLPFEHDHYLKLWALTSPKLNAEVIFLDEAQDSNPVLADLVRKQTHAQQIVVGDGCQPTGTLVTVVREPCQSGKPAVTEEVPIETIKVDDLVVSYNIAHRYLHRNGSRVAGISARPFQGYLVTVEDAEGRMSHYTPDHHSVVRFGEDIAEKYVVYLMQKGDNYRVGVTSGRMISERNKRIGLIQRASAEKADAMWLLDVYPTKAEALTAEALIAWTYGVPDVMFRSARHGMGEAGIEKFWTKMGGNRSQASHLLFCYGRDIDFPIWKRGQSLQTRRPFVTRACNLISGMEVLPLTDELMGDGHAVTRRSWLPISVERSRYYDGEVWSMTVEGDHTYIGDGIVTHNCQQMYAWRGAVDALATWPNATQLYLTQSWRFGEIIAQEANQWLSQLDTPMRLSGNPAIESKLAEITSPDAVLCRTNSGALSSVMGLLTKGEKVALVGGGDALAKLASAAADLLQGRRTSHPELAAFADWQAVRDYAQEDSSSGLRPFVKLVDDYGPETIIETTKSLVKEEQATVVVSTTHKAKGREWDTVRLNGDFFTPAEGEEMSPAEVMIVYVAVTRAKKVLDLGVLADNN